MALRYDVQGFKTEKMTRTPQGGVVIPAAISRTGVLSYTLADGTTRNEYRPEGEVFDAQSLATLRAVAVTNRHPDKPVTPQNFKKLSIGHVDGQARVEGKFVEADLAIDDSKLVEDVEKGDLKEVSAGYTVDLDETPGISPEGIKYDAIQRNIRFNHVALGPPGWGRSGPEVSLRVDSQDAVQLTASNHSAFESENNINKDSQIMKMITIDGSDFVFGSEEHLAKVRSDSAKKVEDTKAESKSDMEKMQAKYDALQAKYDALFSKMEEDKKKDTEKKDSEFQAKVDARVQLLKKAELFVEDLKADGKSDREIMLETIVADDAEFKADEKSDDYVRARFDLLEKKNSGMDKIFHDDGSGKGARVDSVEEAQKRNEERASNAWKGHAK